MVAYLLLLAQHLLGDSLELVIAGATSVGAIVVAPRIRHQSAVSYRISSLYVSMTTPLSELKRETWSGQSSTASEDLLHHQVAKLNS